MALAALVAILGPKKGSISGPPLIMALIMDIARIKIIKYRTLKTTGTLILIIASVPSGRIHPHIVIF
jgi:hypothetical protein